MYVRMYVCLSVVVQKSRVAVVMLNSSKTLCVPMHTPTQWLIHNPLYTKNEKQPKLGAPYSNSRGMGLLKRCMGSCSRSVLTFASTATQYCVAIMRRMHTVNPSVKFFIEL